MASIDFVRTVRTALLLALSTAVPAAAQDAPNIWDVRFEFGLNGSSGNSSFTILRGGFMAKRVRTDRYEMDFSTVVRYGRNEEKVIADDAKASIKFDWRPDNTWSPFVFVDAARDEIRRLDFQADGGAGVKWTAVENEDGDLSLSGAAIFDYQKFDLPEGSTEAGSEGLVRGSFRLKGERTFGNNARFEHVSFYQPAVEQLDDYVVEVTNSVSTTVVGNLSMALEHLYLRDSRPPPGAEKNDQKYSVLLRLAF